MSEFDMSQRGSIERSVAGALKNAIDAHGPITRENLSSAAKRVVSGLKQWQKLKALVFTCHKCNPSFKFTDKWEPNRKIRCPRCGVTLVVDDNGQVEYP